MADAMDSKSISCDGSRGSSPRPGTTSAESAEFARALLPVLLHELNNHTQYLSALGALETLGETHLGRGEGLARTGQEIEELGWLLGICAGGLGSDLLRDRSERRGLAHLVKLTRKAVRHEGRDLERADRSLPDLDPQLGWRGALEVGAILFAASRSGASPLAFEIEADSRGLVVACRAPLDSLKGDLAARAELDPVRGTDWFRVHVQPGVAS